MRWVCKSCSYVVPGAGAWPPNVCPQCLKGGWRSEEGEPPPPPPQLPDWWTNSVEWGW